MLLDRTNPPICSFFFFFYISEIKIRLNEIVSKYGCQPHNPDRRLLCLKMSYTYNMYHVITDTVVVIKTIESLTKLWRFELFISWLSTQENSYLVIGL